MGLNIGMVTGSSVGGVRVAGAPRTEPAHPFAGLRAGLVGVHLTHLGLGVVAQFTVVNAVVAGGVQVLGPTIADATIGRPAWGFVLATQTFGALAGGLVAAR
jgi:hypothetical protein